MANEDSHLSLYKVFTWTWFLTVYSVQGEVFFVQGEVLFCARWSFFVQGEVFFVQGEVFFVQGFYTTVSLDCPSSVLSATEEGRALIVIFDIKLSKPCNPSSTSVMSL